MDYPSVGCGGPMKSCSPLQMESLVVQFLREADMILASTLSGRQAVQVRDALLTPGMHMVLSLCDGQRSMGQVMDVTAALGARADDVQALLELGWLQPLGTAADSPRLAAGSRYQEASRWARELTKSLGLRGLRLRWAVEAADDHAKLVALLPRMRTAFGAAQMAVLELVLLGDAAAAPQA